MTPEQIAALKETFDKFDKQEIDAVPALELINVLRQLQLTPTSPEITEVNILKHKFLLLSIEFAIPTTVSKCIRTAV